MLAAAQAQTAGATNSKVVHTTKAMHYGQVGAVKIPFQGSEQMSGATGEAKVEGKKNNIEIDARFQGLDDPSKFGLEYLTYVLWAVSPQGRAVNLGELALDHGKGRLKAFTDMQTFGMIVTAEPYAAVSQPGNTVVFENVVAGEDIAATYELLAKGTYSSVNTHIQDAIFGIDPTTPRELFEARNAVRIAHLSAADKYAPAIIAKADEQLKEAESAYRGKQDKKSIEAAAREAAQIAEEARVMAVKQKAEDEAQAQAAAEKKAADDRAARARADADAQAKARADADAARAQAEMAKAEAQKAAQEAARQKQEAEQAKAEALAQQLNTVLATRDTARGLIANMSDVLFKSGSFELLAGARERLAKVSGIVLAYPSLHLSVEGHTDSVGTDDYNQQLSEKRADAVRDYLVQQGISSDAISASGFGKTAPVASNDTADGRKQNRRVELVLSGDAIGDLTNAGASETASTRAQR